MTKMREGDLRIVDVETQLTTDKGWRLLYRGYVFMVIEYLYHPDEESQVRILTHEGLLDCFTDDVLWGTVLMK